MAYEVQTAVFAGPLDLLLHLITRDEVDIYQVSLAGIVDAYLAEMEGMGPSGPSERGRQGPSGPSERGRQGPSGPSERGRQGPSGPSERGRQGPLDLGPATEFLVIAAVLVELKSRRLLPGHDDPDVDEELAWVEERDRLLARLLECKTFKDAGAALARMAAVAATSFPRTAGPEPHFLSLSPDLLGGVTPADVHAAFLRVVSPAPVPRVDVDHVAPIRVSVHEVLAELVSSLPSSGTVSFRGLTAGLATSIDVIVRFLAVLELYKEGLVELVQATSFGELQITWTGEEGSHSLVPTVIT